MLIVKMNSTQVSLKACVTVYKEKFFNWLVGNTPS